MPVTDLYRDHVLPWFGDGGEERDIILASQVRLARNITGLPFPNRANKKQLALVQQMVAAALGDIGKVCNQHFHIVALDGLAELERHVLVEKNLVTQNFIRNSIYRNAYISEDRHVSIMVNEEDHLLIQCTIAGLDLKLPLEMSSQIDDAAEETLDIAFDEKMGYLTSCPTNLGTGLKASVVLHLPGLSYTRNMHNIINISQQLGISVQGVYGDGSHTVGNLFIATNQPTLGFAETDLIDNLTGAVTEIVAHERRARKALLMYSQERVEDSVWRAYGILKHARILSENEVLELISKVRLGIDLELIQEVPADWFPQMILASRPHYIRNLAGNDNLSSMEMNQQRAELIRRILSGKENMQE